MSWIAFRWSGCFSQASTVLSLFGPIVAGCVILIIWAPLRSYKPVLVWELFVVTKDMIEFITTTSSLPEQPSEANWNEIGWELFVRWKRTQIYLTNQYLSPWLSSRSSIQSTEHTNTKLIFGSKNNQSSLHIKRRSKAPTYKLPKERIGWLNPKKLYISFFFFFLVFYFIFFFCIWADFLIFSSLL
jgi:hypothetical protein